MYLAGRIWKIQLKTLDIKNLKRGEKANYPVALGAEEWHDGKFPGFLFGFLYPRLEAEDASNPKM